MLRSCIYRLLLLLLLEGAALGATAQYNNSYNSYFQQQQRIQQQQAYDRSMQMNREAWQRQQQQNQQRFQQNLNPYNGPWLMQNGSAATSSMIQLELMQRYAADDTALALIRMFRRKNSSAWLWFGAGMGAGLGLGLTATGTKTGPGPLAKTEVHTGRLVGGTLLMIAGGVAFIIKGQRYNLEKLTEVLIAREQQRPIPVRYLQQLRPRDFRPFSGEVVR